MTDIIDGYLDDRTTVAGDRPGYPEEPFSYSGQRPGYPPEGSHFPDEKFGYPPQSSNSPGDRPTFPDEKPRYPDYPNESADHLDRSPSFMDEKQSVPERARLPPLTRMLMSGEMSGEPRRDLTLKEKFDVWMVNEGYRRLFVVVFALVHVMIFAFAFLNFDLKDNLSGARTTFGITYSIARSAALVLHFDIAILIFRR